MDRYASSPGEATWKKNKKSLTICMVTSDAESNRSVLTHARIPSPHWRQSHRSHSDAVEITLKKLASLDSVRSAARHSNGANPEDDTPTVTSQQCRRAIFVSGDVRLQDGDIVDQNVTGERVLSSVLFFFPPRYALALAYLALRYAHTPTDV